MIGINSEYQRPVLRTAAAVVVALFIASCSGDGSKDNYVEGSVDELYNSATDQMLAENYEEAAKLYDEVDRQHPYSIWATKAQLMAAYAQYKEKKYDEAVISLDRFIQLHPSSRDAAYAYYLKGLSHFESIKDVKRDQAAARGASKAFEELVRRFPTTRYARDAKVKIDLVRDHLAGKEMEVGRYYQSRGQHLAAINRFRTVVDTYQTTSHVPEALHRLAESYTAIGLTAEAQKVAAILGYNYPASEWYIDSYELVGDEQAGRPGGRTDDRGFFTRAWDWLF